ncbi:MAG TPA: hypothetical protein VFY73_12305 [Ideonella sp.]|uniref:hypothetical protein n=1 Tax=Ideonella sp. TaxID=1929293 RepID=UPI002E33F7D7|nr:hypothetical protein [Ideonella sp.]HEX5684800.1 hypothetical protein [Ideonella sp.]
MRIHRIGVAVPLMLASTVAWAVNVRGRVDFVTPGGSFPMNQAFVELCFAPTNQCLSYRTGYDGMYYFNAVPGPHYVRINGAIRHQLDIPNVLALDIPPLRGN